MNARYGEVETLGPLVRRVLAPNPSPFTYTGTQTHIVGTDEVAIIDPGPDDDAHLAALLTAVRGERVTAILVTHTHRDHSPLARRLAEATGAPVAGCAPIDAVSIDGDESYDMDYAPDRVLADGEQVTGAGWTLTAVATPGHTSNHLCFALPEANALFSGDHVMGWSTSIVSPPDGDMGAYMASLEKLLDRNETIYFPAHGDPISQPRKLVRGMLGHRKAREGQILRRLTATGVTVPALVAEMYRGVDPRLHPAAERSVLAHLIDLERRGLAKTSGALWKAG